MEADGEWKNQPETSKQAPKPTRSAVETEEVKKLRETIAAKQLPVPKTATELERDYNQLKK